MVKKPDKLKFWEKIKCWAHGRKFVGFDHIGNKYFEQLGAHVGRSRRLVEIKGGRSIASGLSPHLYRQELIAPQWRAWLAHTREAPPSIQEITQDLAEREQIKLKAKKLDEEWKARKAQLMNNGEYKRLYEQVTSENTQKFVDFEEMIGSKRSLKSSNTKNKFLNLPNPSLPEGQGETFKPGEWVPSSTDKKH